MFCCSDYRFKYGNFFITNKPYQQFAATGLLLNCHLPSFLAPKIDKKYYFIHILIISIVLLFNLFFSFYNNVFFYQQSIILLNKYRLV